MRSALRTSPRPLFYIVMRGIVFTAFLLPSFAAAFCQAPMVVQNLPDGLEARQGVRLLSITALTDHILRVRESNSGSLPEDASWAVLPAARTAHISVVPEHDGFHTSAIKVTVGPDLLMTLTDPEGQGTYAPWWNNFRLEVHGRDRFISADGKQTAHGSVIIKQVKDNPEGLQVAVR